jgi:Protein of unknown function (DUF4231)
MSQEGIVVDPIMERLEDQIAWYDRKSIWNQHVYKRIKVIEIFAAAIIPLIAALPFPEAQAKYKAIITGGLGVLITVLEGLVHLYQYQQNWITYRSTCETLKHEKYTYLGKASPYSGLSEAAAHALLAERIESSVSQEHAKWASSQNQVNNKSSEPVF